MDTLTVALVIRMTGLLLLTPAEADGSGPMHALLPQTGHLPEAHVAQVGYRAPECASRPDGICWRDLDGWSLQIGPEAAPAPIQLPFPESNLSHNTGLFVSRSLLGPAPETSVLKSRVTVGAGSVTGACALGRWSIRHDGPGVPMANVIEWTILSIPRESAVLRATSLRHPGVTETIRPAPNAAGAIEVYIRHVPKGEAEFEDGVRAEYQPDFVAVGEPTTHFHPLYSLLGASPEQQHPPLLRGVTGESCRELWPIGRPVPVQQKDSRLQNRLMASTTRGPIGATTFGGTAITCLIGIARPGGGGN